MDDFETIIEFRTSDSDKPTIPIDSKTLVIGCIAFGVQPLKATSNGTKTKVFFYCDEVESPVQQIQMALAGINKELLVNYCAIVTAETLWAHLMSLQFSLKDRRNNR